MLALLQVTSAAGNGTIKESAPKGIKSAFGAIGASLFAAAGSVGVQALAKKALGPGAAAQYTPAAQSRIGEEFVRAGENDLPRQTDAPSVWKQYKPALIVGGVGLVVLVGAYAWRMR